MNHTPTPWKIIPLHESEVGSPHLLEIGVKDYNGRVLASVDSGTDEDNANAAYIVQAVNSHEDMVEALEDLIRHNEALNEAFYGQGTATAMRAAMSGQKALLMKARAAIAKGKGGQP